MRQLIEIRGRILTDSDIEIIRTLVDKNKHKSRCYLSRMLASEWQWYQPNGRLKDRACRDILACLERQGFITLPALRRPRKQVGNKTQQLTINFDFNPIPKGREGHLHEYLPLSFKMVCQHPLEPLWNQLMANYHYLGYNNLVGSHLKYLVYTAGGHMVAALGWGSAVWKLEPRDRAIGWTVRERKAHLHQVVNNYRFLILPQVKIPCLASHILSQNIRMLNDDWYQRYHYKLSLLESFVDARRFKGTCYRAANWIYVGQTKGFAKRGNRFHYHGQPKEVFLYPLSRHFRKELGASSAILPPLRHPAMRDYLSVNQTKRGGKMILEHKEWNRHLPPSLDLDENDIEALGDEFEQFHRLFQPAFYRVEQVDLSRRYLQGLMSSLKRKSVEPIALSLMEPKRVRSLQLFMSSGKWHTETLATLHRGEAAKTLADEPACAQHADRDGVISVDSSEFPKKGKESVGVARQWCGRLGKVENCQSGVFLAYSSSKGYGLIDRRLFLPERWFSEAYQERWQKCKIPADTTFKTKTALALEMVHELHKEGLFPGKWLACDEFFGRDSHFLDNLPKELFYFAEVPRDTRVWPEPPAVEVPSYRGRGRKPKRKQCRPGSTTVSELSKNKSLNWQRVTLAEGAKGPIVAEVTRLPVFDSRNGLPGKKVWLFIRRYLEGHEVKYFLSNAPVDTPFDEMCHVCVMRWPIEQCFQEGKSELGMDHYEHRSWEAWHRHMIFVFIAHLFLLRVRHKFKKNSGTDTASSHTAHENNFA